MLEKMLLQLLVFSLYTNVFFAFIIIILLILHTINIYKKITSLETPIRDAILN